MSTSGGLNRVNSGVPTGGQFAVHQRGEADVNLGADDGETKPEVAWTRLGDGGARASTASGQLIVSPHGSNLSDGYDYRVYSSGAGLIGGGLEASADQAMEAAAAFTEPITSEDAEDDDGLDGDEKCQHCEEDLSDNEGYDGYCGNCADMIDDHEDGGHATVRDGCPTCEGS